MKISIAFIIILYLSICVGTKACDGNCVRPDGSVAARRDVGNSQECAGYCRYVSDVTQQSALRAVREAVRPPPPPPPGPHLNMGCELRKPEDSRQLYSGNKVLLPPYDPKIGGGVGLPPGGAWSCFSIPPTLTLTRIYCVMSEENGPEGKCSANLSPPANEGLSHRIDCEVGEAGKGFDNYIRKAPNGDNLVCWFGLNDSREKTRIFQVFGDTVGPKVGVEPSPVPDCVSQKPNGKVLIESEKIALQPKGTVGSMNQSCFRLKPGQKLKAAYCVMKDKDAEGKCVFKQDCDIGDARVGQSSGPIVENGVSYQCVEAVNLSDKVREFQVFGE